ncbi:iron ABC transporter ATP-binding protein [Bordetella sp. N]|nr:iron ABC transporter ATP-binding protein [Bordetella sp. N]
MMADPLTLENLRVAYGRREVLRGAGAPPLTAGTVTALLGSNGSGKSTLLKTLGGLAAAQSGRACLGDFDLLKATPQARAGHVVYMPQALPKSVHLTVFESVVVAAHARDRSRRTRAELERVHGLLESLGIAGLAQRHLDELSGGQKQLVGLAQALVRRPRLLLLDEPLSALDLNYQFHVMRLLRRETREQGLVTLVVLHDLDMALRHADQAWMLSRGEIVAAGAPGAVITPATLAQVYGVQAQVLFDEGFSHVHVDGLVDEVVR